MGLISFSYQYLSKSCDNLSGMELLVMARIPLCETTGAETRLEADVKPKTVVFVHGMYMTPLCWEKWIDLFDARGFKSIAPPWPGHNGPVEALRQHPNPSLGEIGFSTVVKYYADFLNRQEPKPILIGHSMGGLVVQALLQQDLAAAGVAIDSAPPMGVLTPRWSFLKSNWPHVNPFLSLDQPVELTFERFQYAFANGLSLDEQHAAYNRYVVPESRRVPRESLLARVDFRATHAPLLLVAGSADHIIPASLNQSNYHRYRHSPSITDYKEFPGRTHLIIAQAGWEEVAGYILAWLGKKVLGEIF
jgi:alpha-beta hydrolase superfamily lysophospholipase